jgi:agmatinase
MRQNRHPNRPTSAICFPFDLFGSPGARNGAELLADALREMLEDTARERIRTRARAYDGKVRVHEITFDTVPALQEWRDRGRTAVRQALDRNHFLLWMTGNHLGVMPVYDELASRASDTVVIQFDAHLDVYNLSDCTAELSHGNFLLHCAGPLPTIVNVGARELLLRPDYVRRYYREVFSAAAIAVDPTAALECIQKMTATAKHVFIDIDCDVFDPAYFPATSHALPFGLSPALLLRFLDAVWSERVIGIAFSEFDPARDRNDQSLATLVWLLEYLLLKQYEKT